MKMPQVYENIDANGTSSSKETNVTFDSSGSQTDISLLFVDAGNAKTILYDPWITGGSSNDDDSDVGMKLNPFLLPALFAKLFFISWVL